MFNTLQYVKILYLLYLLLSLPNLHDFSGPFQKMLFLYLIIKIRSPVMSFSQIWSTLPILEAMFGSG